MSPAVTKEIPEKSLFDRISKSLLLYRKRAVLYPANHPSLRKTFDDLREELRRESQEAGQPYTLETSGERSAAGPSGSDEGGHLRQLLRRHFIKKVAILPDVTQDEIQQFCILLREDFHTRVPQEGDASLDPEEWEHIQVDFHAEEELPAGLSTEGTLLEAASGVQHVDCLNDWFETLPEDLRKPAREAMTQPAVLREFSDFRRTLKRCVLRSKDGQGPTKKVDLVSEVLRVALPRPGSRAEVDSAVGTILSTFRDFARFLESNQDVLSQGLHAFSGKEGMELLLRRFGETLASEAKLDAGVNRLQLEKQRLAFIFQTFARGLGGAEAQEFKKEFTAHVKAASSAGASPPPQASAQEASPVQERLKGITYEPKALEQTLKDDRSCDQCLQIVLESLRTPANRERLREKWAATLGNLSAFTEHLGSRQRAMEQVTDLSMETGVAEAEHILLPLLSGVEDPQETARLLHEVIFPRAGPGVLKSLLERLVGEDRAKAIPILCRLLGRGEAQVEQAARSFLVALAADPLLLVAWAREDPACLGRPEVRNVVEKTSPDSLFESFRALFAQLSAERTTRLLRDIPPGISGMEQILLAAAKHGPPSARACALFKFPDYPCPQTVDLLIGILEENNLKDSPSLSDIRAAVTALKKMRNPRAQAFLDEVARARRWFRHTYRKEIRRALLVPGKES